MSWESQGYNYNGIGWYRRGIVVPESWRGRPVVLSAGIPDDRAETYFNGTSLGITHRFGDTIRYEIPPELIDFGKTNVIAIRVSDWYMQGGLQPGRYLLETTGAFVQEAPLAKPREMRLALSDKIPEPVFDGKDSRWSHGFRDGGLADKQPRLKGLPGAFNGADAIDFDIYEPRSAMEFVNYQLLPSEAGSKWQELKADYLSFVVRSDTSGEMMINLNAGDYKWGSHGWNYGASFEVPTGGQWARVLIPFSAFTTGENKNIKTMESLEKIRTISIGYRNNTLHRPGHVAFSDFRVGRFNRSATEAPIDLSGVWNIVLDPVATNQAPVALPSFAGVAWKVASAPMALELQGEPKFAGAAWYQQKVLVPAAWKGRDLRLCLGTPDDRGEAYWNGRCVSTVEKFGPSLEAILPARDVRYGQENTIVVRVVDFTNHGGLVKGEMSLAPVGEVVQVNGVEVEQFKMPAKLKQPITLSVSFPGLEIPAGSKLHLDAVDHFHRVLTQGTYPVTGPAGAASVQVALTPEQQRDLFYAEALRTVQGWVESPDGTPIHGFSRLSLRMDYSARDAVNLPALAETFEETPYGKLKLVDIIDGAADPETDPHPYKEGGISDSWVGRRAYNTDVQGVRLGECQGVGYREAVNNQHFGWRIGRGKLKPNAAYLLRIRVPDDKPRYFAMDIKVGRNYQGTGYRSGLGEKNSVDPYPQSGQLQWYDHLVFTDDLVYGSTGSRTTPVENGFWVFFHDIGRCYGQGYEYGPGVAGLKLYEIPEPEKLAPAISYPTQTERRALMMDWEREPEAPPMDVARYARFMGMTAISPTIQKWAAMAFWNTKLGFRIPALGSFGDIARGKPNGDIYQGWLDATKAVGQGIIPRVEYGGSSQLPVEAYAVGPNGKRAPVGRYASWGADLCHEATWLEFKQLIDELIRKPIEAGNSQIKGLHWRMRNDRLVISYAQANVERFARETGTAIPAKVAGDQVLLAGWASKAPVAKAYEDWWHLQRRAFLERIRDELKSIRPDLKFYYYNWDQDGWKLGGFGDREVGARRLQAQDWFEYYSLDHALEFYKRMEAYQASHKNTDYVAMLDQFGQAHQRPRMDLYRDIKGIGFFAPVHWYYLANNPEYLNYFKTGDGVSVNMQYYYQEKGRWNVQNDDYETSEMTPGGEDFAMAEHVLACFHADPVAFTETTYTYGIGFVNQYRRFAQAFLALPAVEGRVLPQKNENVRVRLYADGAEARLGIVNKAFTPQVVTVSVPEKATAVVDLVTGEETPCAGGTLTLSLRTCSLNSYRVK